MDNLGSYYYVKDGERQGPLSIDEIRNLINSKVISHATQVWMSGWAEWKKASETDLSICFADAPPPILAGHMSNGYVWMLSFIPIPAIIIQSYMARIIASIMSPDIPSNVGVSDIFTHLLQQQNLINNTFNSLWIVPLLLNVSLIFLDTKNMRKAGYDVAIFKWWMWLFVPVYIYQRDKMVGAGITRAIVWIIVFMISFSLA